MTTLLLSHADCLYHDTGSGHPETPDRLRAVAHALDDEAFPHLARRDAPLAGIDQLCRAHAAAYVDQVFAAVPEQGLAHLDADTVVSPGSAEASLRAAGAVTAAVDAVVGGEAGCAFCAVRPPGHHAEPARAMGFCLFNNVAVGACHARASHGLRRIAVIDFDVHHGNGTEAMFRADRDLFYASTHQWPLYPGTGEAAETGVAGNIVNCPLPPESGSQAFRAAMAERILPALRAFRPELVMISAGFDAHQADPLANLNFTDADYGWATEQLCEVAAECADGRVVSTLEGGYNLVALGTAVAAHVRALEAAGA